MSDNRQLPLDLPLEPRFGEEDFLVSESNASAYQLIEGWQAWPGRMLLLTGPSASGKSHLAHIWAARSHASILSVRGLTQADIPELATVGAVVVEDIDAGRMDEAALFHLINLMTERGGYLMVTGRTAPAQLRLSTADLESRLRRMPMASIAPPDDALIRALFVKLFVDRQLVVDTALVDYLAVRVERSFMAVRNTVAQLDREALALGKRLTRAAAAKILGYDKL
jgi:chromosomal replication initiation ATPase DnaA